jgi:hypothetical protein
MSIIPPLIGLGFFTSVIAIVAIVTKKEKNKSKKN